MRCQTIFLSSNNFLFNFLHFSLFSHNYLKRAAFISIIIKLNLIDLKIESEFYEQIVTKLAKHIQKNFVLSDDSCFVVSPKTL